MPEWIAVYEVYNIMEIVNTKQNISEIQLILSKLKILSIAGELNIENKNATISKILKFVSRNNISDIFRLGWINEELKKELEMF